MAGPSNTVPPSIELEKAGSTSATASSAAEKPLYMACSISSFLKECLNS